MNNCLTFLFFLTYEFLKWRTSSKAWELALSQDIFLPASPTTKTILKDPLWRESIPGGIDPKMVAICLGDEYVVPKPFTPRAECTQRVVWTIMPTEIENIISGRKTVDEAVEDMTREINKLL